MTNESKITALIVLTGFLAVYHYQQWSTKDRIVRCPDDSDVCVSRHLVNETDPTPPRRAERRDVCRAIDVLTLRSRPPRLCRLGQLRERERAAQPPEDSTASTVTIVVLLFLLSLKSVHDAVQQSRREAARRALEPEGERRRSLAEFADRRPRRSSRLLRLSEPLRSSCNVLLTRGDSACSYLAERSADPGGERAPTTFLLGGRPALVRRCSFPARLEAPQEQRDSEDEGDPRMRRVRLIRRR